MDYTETFFSEKLRVEVSYFNPFKIVKIGESLNVKELEKVAHTLPESVGVALRSSLECPVEISLTPDTLRQEQMFAVKKPFLIGAFCLWLSIFAVILMVKSKTATLFKDTSHKKTANVERLEKIKTQINIMKDKEQKALGKYNTIKELVEYRYDWPRFLNALQLHKPQDVWLTGVTKMQKPKTDSSKRSKRTKKSNPFARKKEGKSRAVSQDDYAWFNISGYAISVPSTDPIRKIYTDEQVEKFEEILRIIG